MPKVRGVGTAESAGMVELHSGRQERVQMCDFSWKVEGRDFSASCKEQSSSHAEFNREACTACFHEKYTWLQGMKSRG